MSREKPQPETQGPAKWQLVSWQKKDQQFSKIPSEWMLKHLPTADVTNYTDIPRKCGLLTKQELSITEDFDAVGLADAIRSKKLTCVAVASAFCKVRTL